MNHTAAHDLLGAYALDACDTSEGIDVERHVEHCEACTEELRRLRDAVRLLRDLGPKPSP